MEIHGWVVQTSAEAGSPFGHATTMLHPIWGHADLHRIFPGTTVDPEVAFLRLWRTRGAADIAGITCPVPGRVDHAMILALNVARGGPHAATDLEAVWTSVDDHQQDAIRVAGLRGRGGGSSRRGDRRARPPHGRPGARPLAGDERRRHVSQEWRARIKAAPTVRERLQLIARAPRVNTEHLEVRLGRRPSLGRCRPRVPLPPLAGGVRGDARPGRRSEAMSASYRRPAEVAFVERTGDDGEPIIELAMLPDGPVARLEGSAAVIWSEAIRAAGSDLPGRIAARTDADAAAIAGDVASFLDELVERGLRLVEEPGR